MCLFILLPRELSSSPIHLQSKILFLTSRQTHRWWWEAATSERTLHSPQSVSRKGAVSYPCSERAGEKMCVKMFSYASDTWWDLYIYGFQLSRHRLNRVHIHSATNRKRKVKTIAADRHRGICWGLRCVCWQELSAVEYRSREIPLLARFAESSLPNWVTHGSNVAGYIFLTITTVSLMLWGAKVHKKA